MGDPAQEVRVWHLKDGNRSAEDFHWRWKPEPFFLGLSGTLPPYSDVKCISPPSDAQCLGCKNPTKNVLMSLTVLFSLWIFGCSEGIRKSVPSSCIKSKNIQLFLN